MRYVLNTHGHLNQYFNTIIKYADVEEMAQLDGQQPECAETALGGISWLYTNLEENTVDG